MGYDSESCEKGYLFAKATVDDLVALEQVMKHDLNEAYEHTDEEDLAAIAPLVPVKMPLSDFPNPVYAFRRAAKGARITKPRHIFLLVGRPIFSSSLTRPLPR